VLSPSDNVARSVTSHDIDALRARVASTIILAHLRINTIGANGADFAVTFSDGGTETYMYAVASGVSTSKGDLVPGDGESQCP
jgi:hypothetical protein